MTAPSMSLSMTSDSNDKPIRLPIMPADFRDIVTARQGGQRSRDSLLVTRLVIRRLRVTHTGADRADETIEVCHLLPPLR